MAANIRKQIREHVAAAVATVFTAGPTSATRVIDARDGQPCANVFFNDGSAEFDGLKLVNIAELDVGIHLNFNDSSDDDLDNYGDAITDMIAADPDITLDTVVAGLTYSGFEYGDPDAGSYISLYLKFTVQY